MGQFQFCFVLFCNCHDSQKYFSVLTDVLLNWMLSKTTQICPCSPVFENLATLLLLASLGKKERRHGQLGNKDFQDTNMQVRIKRPIHIFQLPFIL